MRTLPNDPAHTYGHIIYAHMHPSQISAYYTTTESTGMNNAPCYTRELPDTVAISIFAQMMQSTGINAAKLLDTLSYSIPYNYKWDSNKTQSNLENIQMDLYNGLAEQKYYIFAYYTVNHTKKYSVFIPPITLSAMPVETLFTFLVYWYCVISPTCDELFKYYDYNRMKAYSEIQSENKLKNNVVVQTILETIASGYNITLTITGLLDVHSELMYSFSLYDSERNTLRCNPVNLCLCHV
jgi:hypothetical protein